MTAPEEWSREDSESLIPGVDSRLVKETTNNWKQELHGVHKRAQVSFSTRHLETLGPDKYNNGTMFQRRLVNPSSLEYCRLSSWKAAGDN